MNWLPVNGGPLNGGSRLALVTAASAIACSSLVVAAAVRAQEALSAVYSEAKITASAVLQKPASAGLICVADMVSAPKRELRPYATCNGTADVLAGTKVNRSSTAAVQSTAELTGNATRNVAGALGALASASFSPTALKTANPGALVSAGSVVNAVAQRSVFASLAYGSASCDFDATPDATASESGASFTAGVVLQIAPIVTRHGVAALWCGVDAASIPVRVVEPTAVATTDAAFTAQPYVTVGEVGAVAQVVASMNAAPYVECYGSCVVLAGASVEASCSNPTTDPSGFDPENRTFYRRAINTVFVRNASITEFRRPA